MENSRETWEMRETRKKTLEIGRDFGRILPSLHAFSKVPGRSWMGYDQVWSTFYWKLLRFILVLSGLYVHICIHNISCIYILIYLFEQKSHNLALPLSPKVALGPWFWILGYPIRERISTSISRIPIILGFDQPPQVSTHVPGQRSRLSESSGELVQNWWYLAAGISAAGASILPKPNHLPSQA